jgi:GGDEF domain-containing protein
VLRTIYAYRINARGTLAITRGELGDARGAGGLVDTEFGLYTFTYFDERLTQEVAASRRYKMPLSMILAAFDASEFAPGSQEIAQAMRHLVAGAKESLRDCDCAALFREDCLAALLTDTDAGGVPFALKRMQVALDKITDAAGATRLALQPGAVTLDESHATARAFFDDARTRLHRLQSGEPIEPVAGSAPPPTTSE